MLQTSLLLMKSPLPFSNSCCDFFFFFFFFFFCLFVLFPKAIFLTFIHMWRLVSILFVPHLSFFWCLGKAVISWVYLLTLLQTFEH